MVYSRGPCIKDIHAIFHMYCINGLMQTRFICRVLCVEKDVPLDILFERYDTSSVAYGIFRDQDQV